MCDKKSCLYKNKHCIRPSPDYLGLDSLKKSESKRIMSYCNWLRETIIPTCQ